MNSQSSGSSGLPYSAIQLAPASSLLIPLHVQQRHLADDGAEQIGPAGQHVAHEQAAVAAAHGCRDAAAT